MELLTNDIQEAMLFSKYQIVSLPSFAQDFVFSLMNPYLSDDHVIIGLNGNFSALAQLGVIRSEKNPTLVETNVAPHASRVSADGIVTILGTKSFLPIASLPSKIDASLQGNLQRIFPNQLEWCDNVLEVALQSNNGVLHPVPSILNAGWIESKKGDFYFYRDGISPSVGKIIEQIDNERIQIGRQFGFTLRSLLDEMNSFYGLDYDSISDFAFNTKLHNLIKEAPPNLHHRYVTEDVPYTLVPWQQLGEVVGVEAKTMKSIIDLSSIMNGVDYSGTGRNLERLGVRGMDRDELLKYVSEGAVLARPHGRKRVAHPQPANE